MIYFKIYRNTFLKILYLKGCKCLLSQVDNITTIDTWLIHWIISINVIKTPVIFYLCITIYSARHEVTIVFFSFIIGLAFVIIIVCVAYLTIYSSITMCYVSCVIYFSKKIVCCVTYNIWFSNKIVYVVHLMVYIVQ